MEQALNAVSSRANNLPSSVTTALKSLMTPAYDPSNRNHPFVPAYNDKADYRTLYSVQDKKFKTLKDLERFQKLFMRGPKTLSQDIRNLEHRWFQTYFNPLVEFMGDRNVWHALGIDVPDENRNPTALKRLPVTPYHVAYFSGAHWVSRRAGTKEVFDPYEGFQIPGSNQFCQTYAMMYLLGDLQKNVNSGGWLKYYTYTTHALNFIKKILDRCKRDPKLKKLSTFTKHKDTTIENLEAALKVCLEHPYMCLNIAPLPMSQLR